MARVFDGSTQYLSASSTLLSNEPIDMVVYGKADIDTATMYPLAIGDGGAANGQYALQFAGAVASDPIRTAKLNDAGSGAVAATTTGFTTGTWAIASASFISDTSRDIFKDGGLKGSNAISISDPTPNFISIGAIRTSTVAYHFDGTIAEAYVLDKNMGDSGHASVGLGFSPLWSFPISNVRGWYPLQSDNNNRMAGGYPDLAATGSPTDAIHPFNVVYPSINGLITL